MDSIDAGCEAAANLLRRAREVRRRLEELDRRRPAGLAHHQGAAEPDGARRDERPPE